jgi:hypothetical protein
MYDAYLEEDDLVINFAPRLGEPEGLDLLADSDNHGWRPTEEDATLALGVEDLCNKLGLHKADGTAPVLVGLVQDVDDLEAAVGHGGEEVELVAEDWGVSVRTRAT